MKILKSRPLASEQEPTTINLLHNGIVIEKNFTYIEYDVKGTIFSINTNTKLEVHKKFTDLNDAELYFNKIIKEFPKSEIILKHITNKEIKVYV